DWSSDVCSSDLQRGGAGVLHSLDLEAEQRDRAADLVDGDAVEGNVVLEPVQGNLHSEWSVWSRITSPSSGKLPQEAKVVLVEIADVIDAVDHHGEPFEAHAEGVSTPL